MEKIYPKTLKDRRLYRVMPLRRFVKWVETETMTFAHPSTWQKTDVFENLSDSLYAEIDRRIHPRGEDHTFYVSSWSKVANSTAMWQVYGGLRDCERPEDAADLCVQLSLVAADLLDAIDVVAGSDGRLHAGGVRYLDAAELAQHGANTMGRSGPYVQKVPGLHFLKRSEFAWEQEIRMAFEPDDQPGDREAFPAVRVDWRLMQGMRVVIDPRVKQLGTEIAEVESLGLRAKVEGSDLCLRKLYTVPLS